MKLHFSERLNIITGDNGLGKTLILEAVWWALTQTTGSAGDAFPMDLSIGSNISFDLARGRKDPHGELRFQSRPVSVNSLANGRPRPASFASTAPVVYARVDGSFSLWDFNRRSIGDRVAASPTTGVLKLTPSQVFDGIFDQDRKGTACNGLIADWVTWQLKNGEKFRTLERVIRALAPDFDPPVSIAEAQRVSLRDARDVPFLDLGYEKVPILHASAALKRIASLAYLMVMAWNDHVETSRLLGHEPSRSLILLMDEVEAHLHPRWQRRMLPALLAAVDELESDLEVQIIATTHSPMVLTSIETAFDPDKDGLFSFDHHGPDVDVRKLAWAKQGDASNWLVSEAFGLQQARSKEAEDAIEAAEAYMRGALDHLPPHLATEGAIQSALERSLAGNDRFWPRWVVTAEKRRGGNR